MTIEVDVSRLLEEYVKDVEEEVEKASSGVASALVNKLKKHSPTGRGMKHYKDGWKKKKVGKRGAVVYNANKPGLTHLLNNGHVVKNQYGDYDRKEGDNHITEQSEWAGEEFVKRVTKAL